MSSSNSSNPTSTPSSNNDGRPQAEWFGSYQGGMLRWNTMKKRSRYTRRYNKDSDMMRRILSATISN
jgi:hypothetical protein